MFKNKKNFLIGFMIVMMLLTTVVSVENVKAEEIDFLQVVEILIAEGVITPEKAYIARQTALAIINNTFDILE